MKSQLFIPKKCKVGFNRRTDTYTGKLGYIICHDGKKWRKEASWESWREKYMDPETFEASKRADYENRLKVYKENYKYTDEQITQYLGSYENFRYSNYKFVSDETINPVEFDNVPTEGFVLNKKAGGYSSGWNHRSTYCRVYDPRGFEFEISIPNLLYILQECNAYKGKGLEGSFVYSWDGKDLVLLPATCKEYTESEAFTKLKDGKIGTKDLIVGATYKDKKEIEYVYLGRFNCCEQRYRGNSYGYVVKKEYVFYRLGELRYGSRFNIVTGLSSFAKMVSETPVTNYAELMDEFNKLDVVYDNNSVSVDEFKPKTSCPDYYIREKDPIANPVIDLGDNTYELYSVTANYGQRTSWNSSKEINSYNLVSNKILKLNNNEITIKASTPKTLEKVGLKTLLNMKMKVFKINKNNKTLELTF